MAPDNTPEQVRHHRHHPFIPAGILIGLGIGLIVNYPVQGVLIGLGCGFVISSFFHHEKPDLHAAVPGTAVQWAGTGSCSCSGFS